MNVVVQTRLCFSQEEMSSPFLTRPPHLGHALGCVAGDSGPVWPPSIFCVVLLRGEEEEGSPSVAPVGALVPLCPSQDILRKHTWLGHVFFLVHLPTSQPRRVRPALVPSLSHGQPSPPETSFLTWSLADSQHLVLIVPEIVKQDAH
jgi:hypothetical protein